MVKVASEVQDQVLCEEEVVQQVEIGVELLALVQLFAHGFHVCGDLLLQAHKLVAALAGGCGLLAFARLVLDRVEGRDEGLHWIL